MNKNEYLQAFKDGIAIFTESYQQKKVLELDEKISSFMKKGKSEEEAIESLGDVSKQIELIFQENHVNMNHSSKGTFVKKFADVICHVIDVMSKNSIKANMKILFDLLILILLVCILKIPFILIQNLGESILDFIPIPFILNLWHLVIEIVYIVVAVIVFLHIFQKWFEKIKVELK